MVGIGGSDHPCHLSLAAAFDHVEAKTVGTDLGESSVGSSQGAAHPQGDKTAIWPAQDGDALRRR